MNHTLARPVFRLPRWQMILYASGSVASALSYQAFATYIQFFYIDILGLQALWVGLVWSLYGLWNAVNDPLAGYLSDRTRSRWGRRIPWIATMFVPLALTFYLLWLPPAVLIASPALALLFYFLVLVLLFDLFWTIVVVNWTALFPEMVPDPAERATVSGWRQFFSVWGLLLGVALPPVLAGPDWSGRGGMALFLALVTVVFFGLSILGSRERPEFGQDETLPFREAIRSSLANRDFRHFLGANLAINFIFLLLVATAPFYTKYVLQIQEDVILPGLGVAVDAGMQTSIFLAVAFIVALPAMPLWVRLARRRGAAETLRLACLAAAVTLLLFFLPRDFFSGALFTAVFGLVFAGLLILPDLLIADLVDADELETGARREGIYFGMNGFVIRLAFTVQGLLIGGTLALTGYVPASEGVLYPPQPALALFGMRWLMAGMTAVAALLAFFFLRGYSLQGARLAEIQNQVAALHTRKRRSLPGLRE
jgi:glycoside/pentoside/hexuronide:cation symporter, GPH family